MIELKQPCQSAFAAASWTSRARRLASAADVKAIVCGSGHRPGMFDGRTGEAQAIKQFDALM